MEWKRMAVSAALVLGVALLPLSRAEAHRHHHGFPLLLPFVAGAAVVGTAAAIATAPFRAVAPAPYYPAYYYGPPAAPYYAPAPAYYAPGYYYAPY